MKQLEINEERANAQNENNNFLNNKTFHVVRADESVLEMENDVETFVAAIKEAGIERVAALNLSICDEPIISESINPKRRQIELGNGQRVLLHTRGYMMGTLQQISDELNLGWLVLEDYEEITEDVMSGYEHGMKTLILVVDKDELAAVVTGHKKVFEVELLPENADLLAVHDDENFIVEGDEQKGEAVLTKKYDAIRFYTDRSRNSETALVKIEKTTSFFMRDGYGNIMADGEPTQKGYWPYTMIEYHLGEIIEQNFAWIIRSRVPMEDNKK